MDRWYVRSRSLIRAKLSPDPPYTAGISEPLSMTDGMVNKTPKKSSQLTISGIQE